MLNGQMTNYIMPTSMDVPPIRVYFEEIPYGRGPGGAKGIGELPLDGTAPAIVNAIENATGVDIRPRSGHSRRSLKRESMLRGACTCLSTPAQVRIECEVNGKHVTFDAHPMARLLDVLREAIASDRHQRGLRRRRMRRMRGVRSTARWSNSCLVPALQADKAEIRTIEGVASGEQLHARPEGISRAGGAQCGICTPGMILAP